MKRYKKLLIKLGVVLAVLLLLFLLRYPIMRGFGNWLIVEDELQKVEALFVLSGGPLDRGNEAVNIYNKGHVQQIVCTGENIPHDFEAVGIKYLESEITRINISRQNVPVENIILIKKGTSTFEEAEEILAYCEQHQLKKVMVLSSRFHTRRINWVLRHQFDDAGIELVLRGAPSSAYNESRWWENEHGLIALNNEYIKIVYYWIKY